MQKIITALVPCVLMFAGSFAQADEYSDTIATFKKAGESAAFFNDCYGYAVFPTIG